MGDVLPAVVPPGPDNPLGKLAIQLAEPGYFIHGTNKPFGVGQMVSHGCIRLYDGHIDTLVEMVPNGTPVYIVDQPFKLGWRGSALYVEGHREMYTIAEREKLEQRMQAIAQEKAASVDWRQFDDVLQGLTGVPVRLESI
jgi:L,D-transpeptidase ErfK/SrfK